MTCLFAQMQTGKRINNKKAKPVQRWPRDAPNIWVWVSWKFMRVPDYTHSYFFQKNIRKAISENDKVRDRIRARLSKVASEWFCWPRLKIIQEAKTDVYQVGKGWQFSVVFGRYHNCVLWVICETRWVRPTNHIAFCILFRNLPIRNPPMSRTDNMWPQYRALH